jgi:predicted nucleotidyltransferase
MNLTNNNNENIFGLTANEIERIYAIFQKYSSVRFVQIFGSRATENYKISSDIDFAIMNSGVSLREILAIKSDFKESDLPYFVDILDVNTLTNDSLINQIKYYGKQFYSKS